MLQEGKTAWWLERRQTFSRVIVASSLSLALFHAGAATAQQGDNKKQGLDPVAATTPGSKSAMGEPPGRQTTSAQSLPKPDSAKSGSGSKGLESSSKNVAASDSEASEKKEDKSTLPFPVINSDAVSSVPGVQPVSSHFFPSAIDIHGSAAGVLLHARKETKYDLLSPLSIWLEDGALLVSVRNPSEMVLIATKFGDVCVTAGGDAMVERSDEDLLRVVNLCTNNESVYLNMHDKLWTGSPWGHMPKPAEHANSGGRKGKQAHSRTYEDVESGAVSIAPGYELVIGGHALTMDDVKPEDSVGRRDFKTFEGGRMVVSEISIDNLTQIHDLIKGLNTHGERANTVFADIMKSAGVLKTRQGDSGFEKHVPAPKLPPPRRKPLAKPPANPAKPPPAARQQPRATPPPPAPATSKDKSSAPPASKPNEPAPGTSGK